MRKGGTTESTKKGGDSLGAYLGLIDKEGWLHYVRPKENITLKGSRRKRIVSTISPGSFIHILLVKSVVKGAFSEGCFIFVPLKEPLQ